MSPPVVEPGAAQVYRRLLGYLRPHLTLVFGGFVAMMVVASSQTGLAAVMKPLLDESFVARNESTIRTMPFAIVGLFLLRGIATFVSTYTMNWVGRQVIKRLRSEAFAHLLRLPVRYFDSASSAALISRVTYNIEQVAEATTNVITVAVRDSLQVVGLLGWMAWLNWKLTLCFVFTAPVIAVLIKVVSKRFRRYSTRIQTSMGDVTRVAQEVIAGQRVVKVFGAQAQETARFERINEENRRLHNKLTMTKATSAPVVELLASIGIALIVYVATLDGVLATISVRCLIGLASSIAADRNETNVPTEIVASTPSSVAT
jgi:subfamily B ATP-binding cassette protein MsbA